MKQQSGTDEMRSSATGLTAAAQTRFPRPAVISKPEARFRER